MLCHLPEDIDTSDLLGTYSFNIYQKKYNFRYIQLWHLSEEIQLLRFNVVENTQFDLISVWWQ